MMATHSIDTCDASAARTVHLWGLGCTDADTAAGVAHTVVDLDSDPMKSPILDAAEGLIARLPRRLWGFGLASPMVGELFTGNDGGVPEDVRRAMDGGPLKDRPTADDLCAAMVFDARGWSYNAVTYMHMPQLGATSWHDDTLADSASIDGWIDRFDAGVPSAHAWAAAIMRDAAGNRSVLQRFRGPKAV
jgi:hypothetical protein